MKLRSFRYLLGEGLKNTWANRLMTLASIGVLVACMVIIGLAILIAENVNLALGNLEEQNVVMAFMKDKNWAMYSDELDLDDLKTEDTDKEDATENEETSNPEEIEIPESAYVIHSEKEGKALCRKIKEIANVKDADFVSAEKALEIATSGMQDEQKEYFGFLKEDGENPISCAAKVTITDMSKFKETVKKIEKLDGISAVRSQSDLADKINAIEKGLGVAGVWIIAILIIISLVIVSNTIRVTMYTRKLEISIMKAVGATNAFVRIPFVVEGMTIGLISAAIAEGLIYFCYRIATETIIKTLGTQDIVKFSDMALPLLLVFVVIGVFAGAIGSISMISKYLRREGSEFAAI